MDRDAWLARTRAGLRVFKLHWQSRSASESDSATPRRLPRPGSARPDQTGPGPAAVMAPRRDAAAGPGPGGRLSGSGSRRPGPGHPGHHRRETRQGSAQLCPDMPGPALMELLYCKVKPEHYRAAFRGNGESVVEICNLDALIPVFGRLSFDRQGLGKVACFTADVRL
jgi:hypothetical protein